MHPTTVDAVASELKRFAQGLNLTDTQREHLRAHLAEKQAKLQDFITENPNIARKDLLQKIASFRGSLREQVSKFLTPEQMAKWDAEVAKAKDFLGHSMAA